MLISGCNLKFLMIIKNSVILSWNCKGINNKLSRKCIRSYKDRVKANIVCLQETKCQSWNKFFGRQIWGSSENAWVVQDSQGLSGGLACAWDSCKYRCLGFAQDKHWIWIHLEIISSKERINVINVYSSVHFQLKRILWKELGHICRICDDEPLCIIGDFNSVRAESERNTCVYRRKDSVGFDNFIKDNILLDINLSNASFTWFGPDGKCSKLDRVILNGS